MMVLIALVLAMLSAEQALRQELANGRAVWCATAVELS